MLDLRKAIKVSLAYLVFRSFFVVLNKKGIKNVFELHYLQHNIDTALVHKVSCFPGRLFLDHDIIFYFRQH